MKRGLKQFLIPVGDVLRLQVRTQAPMKRGLKPSCRDSIKFTMAISPNPGPDEEGIETSDQSNYTLLSSSPNPGPDEEGIET